MLTVVVVIAIKFKTAPEKIFKQTGKILFDLNNPNYNFSPKEWEDMLKLLIRLKNDISENGHKELINNSPKSGLAREITSGFIYANQAFKKMYQRK